MSFNHSFTEKQQKFLDRIENFSIRNNVTENMINAAFEKSAAFHNTYSNREYVSRNIFARRLGSIEKELEEAIKKNIATPELPLDKAKRLISEFVNQEYDIEVEFDDLDNVGLAFTTLTDYELPIQVTADLIDFKITHEFDGEIINVENFDSIEDMVENGLSYLDFDTLISVDDDILERHVAAAAPKVSDLGIGDVIIYEGVRREVENISDKSIMLKALDSPDFGGVLVGTAEVLAYDGWQEEMNNKGFVILSKGSSVVKEESPIHFGVLGYGVTAYDTSRTDPETNDYPIVAHITPEGVVTIRDKSLSAEDLERINEQAAQAREKFMADWNELSVAEQYSKLLNAADITTSVNISKDSLSMEETIEKYMPFVIFKEGERPEPQDIVSNAVESEPTVQAENDGTYEIYQLKRGEKTNELRFESLEYLQEHDLSVDFDNYDKVYDGKMVSGRTLDSIYEEFNLDRPSDFKGHSLSVSDVIVTDIDGERKAFYIDSFGFSQLNNFYKEAEIENVTEETQPLPPLHIEKYGLTLDFSEISSLDIEWTSTEYLGGIDSDGHERKDNFTERYSNISFYDGGYPDMLIRYDGTAEYATGDYPVPVADAATEIEEYLDKSIDDKSISIIVKDRDGNVNYLDAEKLIPEKTVFNAPVIKNLSQLKKSLTEGMEFEINDHLRPECIGERRLITSVNTVGFYSQKLDENGEPSGKDLYMDWEKAKNWTFNGTEYTCRMDNDELLMSFHITGKREKLENEPVAENISEQSIIENTERTNAEKQTTTVKGNDLNIGDKVLWEGDPYIIESKGGLLGMKPLFETNVNIVSPSLIWREREFEVYEFAEQQKALASDFTEQEMLDIIGNYRYISTPKQDVVAHFNEHTDTDNRADYLRSIYNDDYSELIINDNRFGYKVEPDGLLLWKGSFLSSDEKQTISWDKVAELTAQLIDNEDFLGIDDIAETNDEMDQLSLFSDMSEEPTVHEEDTSPIIQTEAESTVQVEAPAAKKPVGDKKDFVITNENLGEGGAKTKYRANVAAIRTLKEIEAENRLATAAEQQILSQYVGWGGLKNAFEDFHDDWKNEYAELKELLTPEEYAAAAASVLNAHYTSPVVISAMYDALKENGFTGGRILEPAMGVGNFFGVMPTDIRDNSKLYGVELDSISGRIAQQLYQSANIKITGFEKTDIKNDTFDLAVGNVPFGGYSLNEAAYNKYHFQIHDHFFAKSLDKVKPNGIVAFITSKGTMDKNNPAIRKYIAERAELVGAIRLPNNAFKGNAGTEVTSDIIFLQKREYPIELTQDNMPSWIDLGKTEDGLAVNQYFIDNPQMVLGKIVEGNKLYGHGADDTMCIPIEGADLKEQLAAAIKNIRFKAAAAAAETSEDIFDDENIDIPLNVKNFSYAVISDNVYYRNNSDFEKFEGKKSDIPRIKGMIEIRDCLRKVISCQIDNGSDVQLQALQEKLNSLYDSFVEKYGRLNTKQNLSAFKEDSAAPLLSSLEKYKGEDFLGKADIFDKRTILAKTDVTSVETASEALTLSLAKKAHVDMSYMQQLTGFTAEKIMEDLKGVVFENPMKMDDNGNPHLEAADEYLSGNIRKKLEFLKENYADDTRYEHNIEALEKAMPTRLQAADIDIKLGAPCVPKEFVQQFMYDSFGTPNYMREMNWNKRSAVRVDYSELTSRWSIPNKAHDKANTAANAKFGTKRKSAYEILEDCLNLQSTTVKDRIERDGKEVSVINQTETEFAQEKQRQLQEAFKKWIYAEPDRREEVVDRYNRMFNSTRPREYDGSALEFPGMNSEIKLRKHQRDAVAHALYGGNTLFAHEVGAGKTYEMIAAAMEGKRLGLHNKALLCVPNHLTEQEGADFIKLYPNANILVATANDFSKKNRRRLFAKIATGDYDCVIIGHSQLINLPISRERQERLLNEQINDIIEGIATLKSQQGDNFQIKQMEKTRKTLETKLQKLTEAPVRDDVVNFEELGIDKLIIDEAHMFKNLYINTKMSNISGISTNDNVQKTMDLYLKTQYLDEITGGRGTIMATGTPVSNSISEIYTMMRYLQNDLLEETGLKHFDMWAANFAETVTESQLSPEGNSYQMKTRFAKFNNMPELMALFKECADIKTTDQLGLKIPECEMHTVVSQPSDMQKKLIENLSERAKRIRLRQVSPTEDNMPMITNDGRKIGLDVRLMNPDLPDDENSKLNVCINNVYNIWERTAEQRSTQVIFCDLGVPQSSSDEKKNGKKFSVYDDIKEKLIQKGVPAEEIAFIHSAKTEEAKDKLFAKVRKGDIRVLIGSTQKMGAGTNIQDKLIASHDLDAPWKPSDMEQRRGRMVRQGNENSKVDLYRYVTEGTFDAYLYQMLENKQKFISQIMTSKSPVRSCEDLDEVSLSYAEIKALSAGNPLIKEKMDLDIEVSKLKMLKASHMNSLYDLQDKVMIDLPAMIKFNELLISNIEKDIKSYSERPIVLDDKGKPVFPSIELFGKVYTDKEEAGKALIEACKQAARADISKNVEVGSYQGFKLNIGYEPMNRVYVATLSGSASYKTELGGSESGNFTRLDNALSGMEDKLTAAKQQLERLQNQLEEAMAQLDTPFPHEEELQAKSKRLDELTKQLESAADEKPASELAEIVDPYYIQVDSDTAFEKLKESGITFEKQEKDGIIAVKINRCDTDKVHQILENTRAAVMKM